MSNTTSPDRNQFEMSSLPYQHAIILNNKGVQQLEFGNCHLARALFLEAIESIKVTARPGSRDIHSKKSSCNSFSWSENVAVGVCHTDYACCSFLFRRALYIVPISHDEDECCSTLVAESASIIFNLAMSILIDGFVKNQSRLINSSIGMFEVALAVRDDDNFPLPSLTSNHLVNLHSVIYNNLGWIHRQLCNYDLAVNSFHFLHQFLACMTKSAWEALDLQDCEGLIANLVCNAQLIVAAAA